MKSYQRILLIGFGVLIALTVVGLVLTSDWGSREVPIGKRQSAQGQSPVDVHQMQTAMALAPLAASAKEQDLARSGLRAADHEVDYEFASALYQATSQPVPSTPEIRAIQERIAKAQKSVAEINSDIARLQKSVADAAGNQKQVFQQQLDLQNARLELSQDELDDANQDLEQAGGDPKSRIQRMIDEHNAAAQDKNGELDLSSVGTQAYLTQPATGAFFARARAWYEVRAFVANLNKAEQEATAKAAKFAGTHDEIERQLERSQSQQSKKMADSSSAGAANGKPGAMAPSAPGDTDAAISAFHSLTTLQKRMSGLDSRIRNEHDVEGIYEQWSQMASSRGRGLLHSLFVSIAWMLLIGVAVLVADQSMERLFNRLEPDRRELLTLRAVAHMATRTAGIIAILLLIFGAPTQMATVVALAGAGLTVALKDFIVGFFGWFVLMGKNGIRHGDWVEINGVSGEVVEIGLFYTVLLEMGNWNASGYPTGRRVTFNNSYAIEGHYFNFSTSGQWLWDELQVSLPADRDPYPVMEEIKKIVANETEANAKLAEQEWQRLGKSRGAREFSAGPAVSVRPANAGFEIVMRYVTRASQRHEQRAKLSKDIVDLLRRQNIPQTDEPVVAASQSQ